MGELPNVPIPDPHVHQTEELHIGNHRLSISCWVVERSDHHCGDDLVVAAATDANAFAQSAYSNRSGCRLSVLWANAERCEIGLL